MKNNLLLPDDKIFYVQENIAKLYGFKEAAIIQQLHYWLMTFGKKHDGEIWIYNTFDAWHEQFSMWSLRTIKSHFIKLRKKEIIIKSDKNYNQIYFDRTGWYRLNYAKINSDLSELSKFNSCTMDSATVAPLDSATVAPLDSATVAPTITIVTKDIPDITICENPVDLSSSAEIDSSSVKKSNAKNKKSIDQRKADFREHCVDAYQKLGKEKFLPDYQMTEFFDYWTEHGIDDLKMRYEKQTSYSICRRLGTWKRNFIDRQNNEGRNNA